MKIKKEDIPVTMEGPGTILRGMPGWGGMTVAFNELPAGTDLGPLLLGLKNNSCQCPHWGYLVQGKILLKYDDGAEEYLNAGDVFYMQPGHVAIIQEDTKLIDFSPEKELDEVLTHIGKKMAELSQE